MDTGLLRLRLSDRSAWAREFTARDGATLREGCRRALTAYYAHVRVPPERIGRITRRTSLVRLELQVRPLTQQSGPWLVPVDIRRFPDGYGPLARPTAVRVTARAVGDWPDDDWAFRWECCVGARQWDAAISRFAEHAAARGATPTAFPWDTELPDWEAPDA